MNNPRVSEIKHAQRESQLLREVSNLFLRITLDDKSLHGLYITKVKLSASRSMCTILFHTAGGLAEFEEKRRALVLYKGSLRSALAKMLHGRYTPDLRFKYDEQYDKQRRVDDLIIKLSEEDGEL